MSEGSTSEMAIIVPTFNRPDNVLRLTRAFAQTVSIGSNTKLCFVFQREDTAMDHYNSEGWRAMLREIYPRVGFQIADAGMGGTGFVKPINWMARKLLRRARPPAYLGFMGDDHLPRTRGWDARFVAALSVKGCGYVFGDDGFQGANLSSYIIMKRQIPEALGYFAHPSFKHLYADNAWKALGEATKTITYLDGVLIEHVHPHAGKTGTDTTYDIGNSAARWTEDGLAWDHWRAHGYMRDFGTVRDLVREGKI